MIGFLVRVEGAEFTPEEEDWIVRLYNLVGEAPASGCNLMTSRSENVHLQSPETTNAFAAAARAIHEKCKSLSEAEPEPEPEPDVD